MPAARWQGATATARSMAISSAVITTSPAFRTPTAKDFITASGFARSSRWAPRSYSTRTISPTRIMTICCRTLTNPGHASAIIVGATRCAGPTTWMPKLTTSWCGTRNRRARLGRRPATRRWRSCSPPAMPARRRHDRLARHGQKCHYRRGGRKRAAVRRQRRQRHLRRASE